MNAEVLAVGTELLLGQIVDTNSSWIGEQLALAGIDCHRQVKVGDNMTRIVAAVRDGLARADALIVCGGLGPTQDDLTRDAIAQVMGAPLRRDPAIEARIRAMFASRGREMPANNLRQADVPDGALPMAQQPGTAPGLVCPLGDKVIYAVPGVPSEMREMVAGTVIPDLRRRAGDPSVILSRVLRTWGRSESGVAEALAGRIEALDRTGNPTMAFLASGIEGIKVRLTAKATDRAAAELLLDEEEALDRAVLGDLVFGRDDETMESAVLTLLDRAGLTIALVESATAGLMASRLAGVPGASAIFRGGLVTPPARLSGALLGVPEGPIPTEGAARALAEGIRTLLGADVGLATTAAAEGDSSDGAGSGPPSGTVYVGLATAEGALASALRLPGDPERLRAFATISAYDVLRRHLLAAPAPVPPR